MLSQILHYPFFSHTLGRYVIAICVFGLVLLGAKLLESVVIVRLEKMTTRTKTDIDDVLITAIRGIGMGVYVVLALFCASKVLTLAPWLHRTVDVVFLIVIAYAVIRAGQVIVLYSLKRYSAKQEPGGEAHPTFVHIGMLFARIVLWSVGLLFVLSNLGVNITALAASLGIGSLAIALALQSILGDMFSSFSLYADKPFEVGDFISVGPDSGTVKRIGLKTTRLTTLQGEELVISNNELTTVRVQNFKKMDHRRVVIAFGVEYQTPPELLEAIPTMVEEIVSTIAHLTFNRCHFDAFGDSALLFELVYHVDTREYDVHMDTKQQFNLALFKQFEAKKIGFAYPTQTVLLKKEA